MHYINYFNVFYTQRFESVRNLIVFQSIYLKNAGHFNYIVFVRHSQVTSRGENVSILECRLE